MTQYGLSLMRENVNHGILPSVHIGSEVMGMGVRTKSLRFSQREELTAEKLREQLHYNPDTGVFTWRVSRKGVKKNAVVTVMLSNGYPVMTIGGQRFLASRLAWLYVNGEFPPDGQHIKYNNNDPTDVRIANLRSSPLTTQEHNKRFREKNPTANRFYLLKKNYQGMTEADYMALYVAQGGVCATCKQPETATRDGKVRWLCVDHCHKGGHVRGLLCVGCNTAFGYAKDDPVILRALADYAEADVAVQAGKKSNVIPMKGTA